MPATDRPDFRSTLDRRPILLDAAMGTRLIARGLDLASDDPSLWVVDHPDIVLEIHRLDVLAGSEALLTNTFGANRAWLDRQGRGSEAVTINRRAVALARLAAGPNLFVIGSIGPTASAASPALTEQAEALLEGGVDALILETHRLDQAEIALQVLRGLTVPIMASLHDWPEPVGHSAHRLFDLGALAVGANCLAGMSPAMELARKLGPAKDRPLLIKPSAGLTNTNLDDPDSFGKAVPELIRLGVRLIGGCCGTTEAHLTALRAGLNATSWPRMEHR